MAARPQFLCIGAQKAGTSWLIANLRQHPAIWTPPEKELHYFDARDRRSLISSTDRRARVKRLLRRQVRSILPLPWRWGQFAWYFRYLVWPRTDAAYLSLFRPGPGQICGEGTPAYALLDSPTIQRVARLLPDVRAIYLLRDPVDRIWSEAAMNFGQHGVRDISTVDLAELVRWTEKTRTHRHSAYLDNLGRWEAVLGPERIFVGFLDQIRSDPSGLLSDVHRFLGVATGGRYMPRRVSKTRNANPHPPMPAALGRQLATRYQADLLALHNRFDNAFTAAWLEANTRRLHG